MLMTYLGTFPIIIPYKDDYKNSRTRICIPAIQYIHNGKDRLIINKKKLKFGVVFGDRKKL